MDLYSKDKMKYKKIVLPVEYKLMMCDMVWKITPINY